MAANGPLVPAGSTDRNWLANGMPAIAGLEGSTPVNVVITPGAGFGAAGEGYFRISAFNTRENAEEVCRRIKEDLKL